MSYTAGTGVGNSAFVIGRHEDGNREMRVYPDGDLYDLSVETFTAYTAGNSSFPYQA